MTLRHLGAGALALAMLLVTLTTWPAYAKQCGRLDRSRGEIVKVACPTEGRGAKQSRRHFRGHQAQREARRHHLRVRADRERRGGSADVRAWDNDGRVVFASAVAPVRVARPGAKASLSLAGVAAPLASKAAEIVRACGSRVVSAVRHTRVAGTRLMSLHASGRAVDLAGNPACIYRHLAGWPGGVSTDYGRVRHVHVSYDPGGREWALRFAHNRHKSAKRRVARAGS